MPVLEQARGIPPALADPVVAMRGWGLRWPAGRGAPVLLPAVVGGSGWPPLRPASAKCRRGRRHAVPGFDCLCGFHATNDEERLRRLRSPAVIGSVALWGRVVEHEHGFRGSTGYPQRLALVCFLCLVRHGLDAAVPAVAGRTRWGRLIPLCEEHLDLARRYRFRFASVVGARTVERALLDAYAVDLLPR